MTKAHVTAALLAMTLTHTSFAAGLGTHGELANRALHWFDNRGYNTDYLYYLQSHQDAFQAGAPFPDWGYACGYHDAGEDAHWQPFMRIATQYVYDTYPQPWDPATEKLATFLLGVTAHSISDISWHGLGVSEGFLDAMAGQDFDGSFGDAHTHGDAGGDMIAARELKNDWLQPRWYVPTSDLLQIYALAGHEVSPQIMEKCVSLLFLGTAAEKLGGTALYPYFASDSPFLVEQYLDYFVGGLDDMAIWSAWTWRDTANWLENGASQEGETYWANRRSTQKLQHPENEVSAAVLFAQTLGLQSNIHRSARGITISLDESSIPPNLRPALKSKKSEPIHRPISQSLADLEAPYAYLGRAMTSGDYNGDGLEDFAMGAHGAGSRILPHRGAFYVYLGDTQSPDNGLSLPTDPDGDSERVQAYFGPGEYERMGWSLATLDYNQDGYDDIAAAAPTTGARQMAYNGRIYIYLGSANGLASEAAVTISNDLTYQNMGWFLSSGDADGDGFKDLLVGSPFSRSGGTQRGSAHIFLSGSDVEVQPDKDIYDADWAALGQSNYDWFAYHLQIIDVAGRGRMLLIGVPTVRPGDAKTTGKLLAYELGNNPEDLVPETPAFTINGSQEWDKLGLSFAYGYPNIDGPGLLAVSAPTRSNGDAKQAGMISLFEITDLYGDYDIDTLDTRHELIGDEKFARLGWSLAFEDLNRDALDDLVAGSPYHRGRQGAETGAVYVWLGGDDFPSGLANSPRSTAHSTFNGPEKASRFGESLGFVDIDNNGRTDILISAHRASAAAKMGGSVFVETVVGQ